MRFAGRRWKAARSIASASISREARRAGVAGPALILAWQFCQWHLIVGETAAAAGCPGPGVAMKAGEVLEYAAIAVRACCVGLLLFLQGAS